jgi:hypothetical protein
MDGTPQGNSGATTSFLSFESFQSGSSGNRPISSRLPPSALKRETCMEVFDAQPKIFETFLKLAFRIYRRREGIAET